MAKADVPPTVLLNLWMLKAHNGMYWYARDYVQRIGLPCQVILRPGAPDALKRAVRAEGWSLAELGPLAFTLAMVRAAVRGILVYTPTPHPVPFIRNQAVVVHDPYPFQGSLGRLKRLLFAFGIRSSGCVVAHINHSLCLDFLASLKVDQRALLFAPNVPPRLARHGPATASPRPGSAQVRTLGAFGTDSRKKNYALLLSEPALRSGSVRLQIFGHDNDYTRALKAHFGDASFTLVNADATSLDVFMSGLDAVVSVAEGEGFGRPLASAITAGLPCYLLDSPSFREFFEGQACLYADVPGLLQGMARGDRILSPTPQSGFNSTAYRDAIEQAVAKLQQMAGH